MRAFRIAVAALFVVTLTVVPAHSQQGGQWTFSGVQRINLDGVSGDLIVLPADGSALHVELEENVRPDDAFRGEVEQSGDTVRIREDWGGGSSQGRVTWTLRVPAGMEPVITVDTASGDLEASDVTARFDLDTASGDVTLSNMTIKMGSSFNTASGDLELTDVTVEDGVDMDTASGEVELLRVTAGEGFSFSTASGNVRIEDSTGILEGSSASGNVRVIGSELDGASKFSSASGDVAVELDALPANDLEASSASGDVRLDARFGGNFTLILTKRADRGRIDSPFEFTSERTFQRNGRDYEEKIIRRGSGGPEIRLSTASGSIRIRER